MTKGSKQLDATTPLSSPRHTISSQYGLPENFAQQPQRYKSAVSEVEPAYERISEPKRNRAASNSSVLSPVSEGRHPSFTVPVSADAIPVLPVYESTQHTSVSIGADGEYAKLDHGRSP